MLKRELRLRKKQDIERVYKRGKSIFDPLCGIRFAKNSLDNSRISVVVGKKVDKRAVRRNRIKRRYREIVRHHYPSITPGYDILLMVGQGAATISYQEMEERIVQLLKNAALYDATS